MCARSDAVIDKEQASVYMGYYGGKIIVGEMIYDTTNIDTATKEQFIEYMNKFTKKQLIQLIADLIENSEED